MKCWEIIITGRIQGVGFRPFVYNLAKSLDFRGQIYNSTNGVHIILLATRDQLNDFLVQLKSKKPSSSIIQEIVVSESQSNKPSSFQIADSLVYTNTSQAIPPDLAMCEDCKKEIRNSNNRRYQYHMTSCLNCGPRYSIINSVPYDRNNTTLSNFFVCKECRLDYTKPGDRREHGQLNSCPQCKIPLRFEEKDEDPTIENKHPNHKAILLLKENKILAVKGNSGYLLCVNALSSTAILRLRDFKKRPKKPFAVMYRDIDEIHKEYFVSQEESNSLKSSIAPIVLLSKRPGNKLPDEVSPGLVKAGVFIPNNPLFQIILDKIDFPIIATSGNKFGGPIQFEDKEAFGALGDLSDGILSHDITIVMPQDDSVVQYSDTHKFKIILRRGRGMSPEYLNVHDLSDTNVIALGADIKNTISLQSQQKIWVSQYIGDLDFYDKQKRSSYVLKHLSAILNFTPETILADEHPGYHSRLMAQAIADENKVSLIKIPHHEAHFSAILGEHNLWATGEKIMGIIWDGAGFGRDQNIWGGEFYSYENFEITHIGQCDPVPILGGDAMSKEPRRSALAHFHLNKQAKKLLRPQFSELEWNFLNKAVKIPEISTSSIGRLFDALASILNLCTYNSYEGQAAILLEQEARTEIERSPYNPYNFELKNSGIIHLTMMKDEVIDNLMNGLSNALIAYKFHCTLVEIIGAIAKKDQYKHLAFSGGVFQNSLLIDLIINRWSKDYKLYFHKNLSPNDENISFGQLMHFNFIKQNSIK